MFAAVPPWIARMLTTPDSVESFAADHTLNIDDEARGHHHGGRWLPAAPRRDPRGRGI
jgi:hypothetical protein